MSLRLLLHAFDGVALTDISLQMRTRAKYNRRDVSVFASIALLPHRRGLLPLSAAPN